MNTHPQLYSRCTNNSSICFAERSTTSAPHGTAGISVALRAGMLLISAEHSSSTTVDFVNDPLEDV